MFPFPRAPEADRSRALELIRSFREYAKDLDPRAMEEQRWIGDDVVADLGRLGLLGLGVPTAYGGAEMAHTECFRVFESIAELDPGLAIVLGIHESIGTRGIAKFGTDEQKERFLPDLALGRRLSGFALTERGAGSDAYNITSRAVQQPDGAWRLTGEKLYVGNASVGSVFTVIARAEVDGRDRHIALIVESSMDGFEVGPRWPLLGVEANDVAPLYFHDVRVPAENVLGEPGQGFRIAMEILNEGRLGLSICSIGAAKRLTDLATAHVMGREQFGRRLADLELVKEKIAWMTRWLFGLECACYLTTGLKDAGVQISGEAAVCKLRCSEFAFELANVALQLRGGAGYIRQEPYEKFVRDLRVFPVFEGANDVLRAYVALTSLKSLAEGGQAQVASSNGDSDAGTAPLGTHPALRSLGEPVMAQAAALSDAVGRLTAEHGMDIIWQQLHQARLVDAATMIYTRLAVLSRVSQLLEERTPEECSTAVALAQAFCDEASLETDERLKSVDSNDDPRVAQLAEIAYAASPHGHAFPRTDRD